VEVKKASIKLIVWEEAVAIGNIKSSAPITITNKKLVIKDIAGLLIIAPHNLPSKA
jgi:hypothetical protein